VGPTRLFKFKNNKKYQNIPNDYRKLHEKQYERKTNTPMYASLFFVFFKVKDVF
jgi:hypothetical protein